MKKAVSFYEDSKDRLDYTISSWLHLSLGESEEVKTKTILGAASFLFDNLFAKEDAGRDLTQAVHDDLGTLFSAKALSDMATLIRVNMSSDVFAAGQSPLRDYLKWVAESEPEAGAWINDNAGKLVICTAEEIVNALLERKPNCEPLRVAELLFLNLTEAFAFIYKETMGPRFYGLKSYPYFESVLEAMEGIRGEIRD